MGYCIRFFFHDHRCLSKAIFVIDILKSTSVASVLGVFAEGPVENLHFLLIWQSQEIDFCFANTTAKGFFLVKAVSDFSALIKQRTWRGKASYTERARGLKCSFRCLTELCKGHTAEIQGSLLRPDLHQQSSWIAHDLTQEESCCELCEEEAELSLKQVPRAGSESRRVRGSRVQLMVTSALLVPAQHSEQLAPVLSSALPLHSPQVFPQTLFRTRYLRWERSQTALRRRKVPTRLPGMRVQCNLPKCATNELKVKQH